MRQPENLVPGRPLFFATAVPFAGIAAPVLVESHEGHPTKVEGNPQHPASLGGSDIFTQASILGLYDPDRLQVVRYRTETRSWPDFVSSMRGMLATQAAKQGAGLRFLTETLTSPSVAEQMALIQQAYPQARWHQWEPVSRDGARAAAAQAAGRPADAVYHFDKADIIVSLDADFLGGSPASIRYARDFADRRRAGADAEAGEGAPATMNRLYAIESTPSLTGAKADHRLALRASEIQAAARALSGGGGTFSNGNAQKFIDAVRKDLEAHRGRSLVVAGDWQPAAVHQIAHELNASLGNVGTTVTYAPTVEINPGDRLASLRELVQAMDTGVVDLLVILGANPVFTAPADLNFTEKLAKVGLTVSHSQYVDETAFAVPLERARGASARELERRAGVRRHRDGDAAAHRAALRRTDDPGSPRRVHRHAVRQVGPRSGEGLLDTRARRTGRRLVDHRRLGPAVQERRQLLEPRAARRLGAGDQRTPDDRWPRTVDAPGAAAATGVATSAANQPSPIGNRASDGASAARGGLEIIFRPDPTIWDGRFANNGWLQELPKPLTKITWDPSAWISPRLAEEKGLKDADLIELRYRGKTAKLPVAVMPGHPDQSVTVFFGYGRRVSGRVATPPDDEAKLFDVFALRNSDALWFDGGLEIAKAGRYVVARTQEHHLMEGRAPVRVANVEEYHKDPEVIAAQGEKPPKTMTLIPDWEYKDYKWGMAIDLTSCTGCGACTIACVSENNIPVVGKDAGEPRTRDALDPRRPLLRRAISENPDDLPPAGAVPAVRERAVRARLPGRRHDAQRGRPERHGLQPLRRDALLLEQLPLQGAAVQLPPLPGLDDGRAYEPLRNPDVTVRSRGVMEKCTYCVQRINLAQIDAERRGPADSRRRDRDRVRGGLSGRRDRVRRPQRPVEPGRRS